MWNKSQDFKACSKPMLSSWQHWALFRLGVNENTL
jgi:hypothetical protein